MTVLNALVGHYERLATTGKVAEYGYSPEKISYALILTNEGSVVDTLPLLDTSGSKPRPSLRRVPRPVGRTSGVAANYLWDKSAYVLGIKRSKQIKEVIIAEPEFDAFKQLHETLLADSSDPGLNAFRAFLRKWMPKDYLSLRYAEELVDTNIIFQLEGEDGEWLHERPAAKEIWIENLQSQESAERFCLVTGYKAPVVQKHAKIKGVAGAQSSGASLISFNLDAFKSFSKEQGDNAPVSELAAFAYTTALNAMLEFDSGHRIRIGDSTAVFWAEAVGDGSNVAPAEELFSILMREPVATDAEETTKIADKLEQISRGRPLLEVSPEIDQDTRFFILGLAPNAARISVRFWCQDTIGAIVGRVADHWRDLYLEPTPWQTPPTASHLLRETAAQGKSEKIPPILVGAMLRAILNGSRYPQSLLTAVIVRMRADKNISPLRVAICKACIERDYRLGYEKEGIPVSLDPNEINAAYRLGRLFAVYENLQRAAMGNPNTTIKDRYFGAASATPALVFPLLERNSAHHLANLRKNDKVGLMRWFEREIDSIFSGIDTAFPSSLRLAGQGRFAIGYHHQRSKKKSEPYSEVGSDILTTDSSDEEQS